jgi:hypothetical protein
MIKEAATAANITAEIDHLRGLVAWKTVADNVFLWALAVAGIAAIVVFVCTFLSMRWGDEITDLKDRNSAREIAKARADGIAEGTKAGTAAFNAGERAGQAQADVDAAKVEIAKQAAIAAKANLDTEKLRSQLAWRELSKEQSERILAEASRAPGKVNLEYTDGDPEALGFAQQLADIFKRAGWPVAMASSKLNNVVVRGFVIEAPIDADKQRVLAALSVAGITPAVQSLPHLMTSGNSIPGAPILMVGSKPKPVP